MTSKNAGTFILFVMNKFNGVLQMFLIPDFIFISMKIFHYFSCILRNAPLPCQLFLKIKSPFVSSPTAKLCSVTFAIPFFSPI